MYKEDVQRHAFLASKLDGYQWSASHSACFTSEKCYKYPSYRSFDRSHNRSLKCAKENNASMTEIELRIPSRPALSLVTVGVGYCSQER